MKLYLYVTDKDIRVGKRYDCIHCPIAMAFGRALTRAGIKFYRASANHGVLEVVSMDDDGDRWITHRAPTSFAMSEFMADFDCCADFASPSRFVIKLKELKTKEAV